MSLEIRGLPWSAVMTTRPGIANPVTNSSQTPMAYFALCVPVESANRGFNSWASCKVRSSVGYAYEVQNAPKCYRELKFACGEKLKVAYALKSQTILHRGSSCRRLP